MQYFIVSFAATVLLPVSITLLIYSVLSTVATAALALALCRMAHQKGFKICNYYCIIEIFSATLQGATEQLSLHTPPKRRLL